MTIETRRKSGAGARPSVAGGRLCARGLVLVLIGISASACGLKPEQRLDDPECQYCYRLPSGVTYKTYEYYAP